MIDEGLIPSGGTEFVTRQGLVTFCFVQSDIVIVKKSQNNTFLARNKIGKAIILKKGKPGASQKVKITGFRLDYLIGKLL